MYIDGAWCEVALNGEIPSSWPFVRDVGDRPLDRVYEPRPFRRVFGFYFDLMVRSLRAGDHRTAAKAAGIVSHIFCDRQPGDHIDVGTWLGLILPPPEDVRPHISDCNAITGQQVDIPRVLYRPQLLGTDMEQAMFRFYHRHLEVFKRAVPQITKMIQAVYAGKPQEAQAILSRNRLLGIELISDFVYTAFCVACDRYEPAQKASLAELDLTRVYPMVNQMDFLYFYGPYTDCVIDFFTGGRFSKAPPELLVARKGAAPATEIVQPVLGVLPDSGAQWPQRFARLIYELPVGVYKTFVCLAGMPPRLSVNAQSGLKGKVSVKVLGDGKVLFERIPVLGGEQAFEINVPLAGVRQLELLVTGLHKTTDDFWLGHFIWGRPRLVR
jgi:hypothetical protein